MKKNKIPVLNMQADREKSLHDDTPAMFEIERDPKNIKWDLWDEIRTFDSYGKNAVRKYDDMILRNAQKHDVDPDLIRAVMYAENARGHYVVVNKAADLARTSNSILPMNIQNKNWSKVIDKEPDDLYDPENNIEASTVLLKRIRDRIKDPTPEKIGSIWNFAGKEKTSEFGEYIGSLYHEKPWAKIE